MNFKTPTYFIKNGYIHNLEAKPYGCTEEDSIVYQRDVYKFAANLVRQNHLNSILDLGCGHGMKLKEFIAPLSKNIVGIDWEDSISFCKSNHHFGKWFVDNIEEPKLELNMQFDLIICADVIEHLFNPNLLFSYLSKFSSKDTFIIISTPERDLRRGIKSLGPPKNPAHVREWNKAELALFLNSKNTQIIDHLIVDLRKGEATCQLINLHLLD